MKPDDKKNYDPVQEAEKTRALMSNWKDKWRRRLVAAAITAYGLLSGNTVNAKTISPENFEKLKDLTELPIASRQVSQQSSPEETICQMFEENREETKQKFCENMADSICQAMVKEADSTIANLKKLTANEKNREIRRIFQEVTGTPARASYCLAGLMSNYMSASKQSGYPELNDMLPLSKTHCKTFMSDSQIKQCLQKVSNDTQSIMDYVNGQDGETFLLFLPRAGGSGYHATMLKKGPDGLTVNAYNREHVNASLNTLVNYSRKQAGTKRAAVVVNMKKYTEISLEQQIDQCQTPEECMAYVTKGKSAEEVLAIINPQPQNQKKSIEYDQAIALISEEDIQNKINDIQRRAEEKIKESNQEVLQGLYRSHNAPSPENKSMESKDAYKATFAHRRRAHEANRI